MTDSHIKQIVQSCSVCHSRSNCIFCDLDHSRLRELDRMQQRSVYTGGVVIFTQGDQPQGVYFVCSGRVKLSIYSSDGKAVIVRIATIGDVLGAKALLSGKPHNLTAETLELTQLCFIKKNDFINFLRGNGKVGLRLAQKLSNELYEAYRGVGDISLKHSHERLKELLLRFCKNHGKPTPDGIKLEINLSQEELAEMISVSRRTLTRVLMELKSLGIIRCGYRSIIVCDRVVLENSVPEVSLF